MHWKKVSLIGVGLLGGSLGLALKRRRLAESVVGFVRRAASIAESESLGAVDHATRNLQSAVTGAELIVFCTPLAQMRPLAERMLPFLKPGVIITDVGSVKGKLVQDLETLFSRARAHFIGSHPLAGGEKTGVAEARAELFTNAVCVITPTRRSNKAALLKVEALWRSAGSRLVRLTPEAHDELVSRSSHLPHVLAAQLANFVLSADWPREQAMLCANGFRDTTRVASGSPEMWRDIALANRENLVRALAIFTERLNEFRRALKTGNHRAVSKFFEQAKDRRDVWARKAGPT